MRKLAFIPILFFSLFAFCLNASAQSISDDEYKQIGDALEQYQNEISGAQKYGTHRGITENIINIDSSNYDTVYKSFFINNLIIDEYEKTNDFSSLISEKYQIFARSGNRFVTFINKNGKLKAIGSMLLNENNSPVDLEKEAEQLKKSTKDEIIDLKFAKSYRYNLTLIYYQTAQNEYIVPYFSKNELNNVSDLISNGKIYSADDFVVRMNCIYDITTLKSNENGGIALKDNPISTYNSLKYNNDDNKSIEFDVVMILGVILVSSVVLILIQKRRVAKK